MEWIELSIPKLQLLITRCCSVNLNVMTYEDIPTCFSNLTVMIDNATPPCITHQLHPGNYNVEYHRVHFSGNCFLFSTSVMSVWCGSGLYVIISEWHGFTHGKSDRKGTEFHRWNWKNHQLYKWYLINKLTINTNKICFVLFHTVNKPVPDDVAEIVKT